MTPSPARAAGILLLVALAGAAPAHARRPTARQQLEQEVSRLEHRIDRELMALLRDQVRAALYLNRLAELQRRWRLLLPGRRGRATLGRPHPVGPGQLRIEEVAGADRGTLARALVAPGCRRREGCRLWIRLSLGHELVQQGTRCELRATLRRGGRRLEVPTRELVAGQPLMVLDLPLEDLPLRSGVFAGELRVVCGERQQARTFALRLRNTR